MRIYVNTKDSKELIEYLLDNIGGAEISGDKDDADFVIEDGGSFIYEITTIVGTKPILKADKADLIKYIEHMQERLQLMNLPVLHLVDQVELDEEIKDLLQKIVKGYSALNYEYVHKNFNPNRLNLELSGKCIRDILMLALSETGVYCNYEKAIHYVIVELLLQSKVVFIPVREEQKCIEP